MVWILILLLALAVFAVLWLWARLDSGVLQVIAAALCLAVAGYAWQSNPSLAGQPAKRAAEGEQTRVGGETFAKLRRPILGQFDQAASWLTMSESYLAKGDSLKAVQIIQSGLREHPQDSDLWTGLGNALFLHAGVVVTPASEFAFDRAQALSPRSPAPTFFKGMAYAQAGGFAEAEAAWRRVLAQLPPGTSWRPQVESRLELVMQLQAMQRARAMQAMPPPGQ